MGTMEPAPTHRPANGSRRNVAIAAAAVAVLTVGFLISRSGGKRVPRAETTAGVTTSATAPVAERENVSPSSARSAPVPQAGERVSAPAPVAVSPVIVTNFGTRPYGSEYRKYFGDVKNVSAAEVAYVKVVVRCIDRGQDYHEYTFATPLKIAAGGVGTFEGQIAAPNGKGWTAEIEGHSETRLAEVPLSEDAPRPVAAPPPPPPSPSAFTQTAPRPPRGLERGAQNYLIRVQDLVVKPPNSIGSVWFNGELTNDSGDSVKILLQAKAYDNTGDLLDAKTFFPSPDEIPPFGHATFENVFERQNASIDRIAVVPLNR